MTAVGSLSESPCSPIPPQISLVSQEPVLFARSITDNISYGLPTVPFEMVVEAAQKANAHGFIMELQDGYSTGTRRDQCAQAPLYRLLPIDITRTCCDASVASGRSWCDTTSSSFSLEHLLKLMYTTRHDGA